MDDDKLKVLKTEITSILASASSPLTVHHFLREYKDVIGRNFPWVYYGFKNPTEFLKSMPDVVCFRNNELGEILVPTENNAAHITKLVQEQKPKPTRRGHIIRRPRPPVQLPRERQKLDLQPLKQIEVSNPIAVRGWERRQPITPLMSVCPALNQSSQNFSYNSSHQYTQFSNLWKFDQMPQSLVLNSFSTVQTEFTSTRLPLIPKKESLNQNYDLNEQTIANGYCENVDQNHIKTLTNIIDDDTISREKISQSELRCEHNSRSEEKKFLTEAHNNIKVESSEKSSSFDDFEDEDNCPIGERMKDNFRTILSKHKSGLLVSKLASSYNKMFNVSLNCQDYGFPTIKDLVMACHDVFKIQHKKHAKDWLLFDVNNQSDDSTRWIPSQVLENMQELSISYPEGISSDKILKLYKNMFKVDLNVTRLGFDSVTSFLVNCQSIECIIDDDKYVVFPMKWGKKNEEPEESNSDPFLSVDTYSLFSKKHFQDDVCGYEFSYEKCPIPTETTVKVLVADCLSPSWIYLQTIDAAASLNHLMYELNTFYDEEEQRYIMDEDAIHPGLACCVKFENRQWHRGLIENIFENSVKVTYVDYGTSSQVSFNDLRTLYKKFSEFPIHSFKSKIDNVIPPNEDWSEACIEFLCGAIWNKHFVAEIVDVKNDVASVILIDTTEFEDYVINFILIERGYGIHETDLSCDKKGGKQASPRMCERAQIEETTGPCIKEMQRLENNMMKKSVGEIKPKKELTIKKNEEIPPDYFLKILPYWLSSGRSWKDVNQILEQASHEFHNESNEGNLTTLRNFLTSTQCVQNKILTLFVKNPKIICDAWNKTFFSFIDGFEKIFLENIEAEFLNNYSQVGMTTNYNINHRLYNSESTSKMNLDKPKVNSPNSSCSESNGSCNQHHSSYESVAKGEDYYYNKHHYRTTSPTDVRSPIRSKESKVPKIIPANMFNSVIHLIRYNSEIYVSMDELLSNFAKGLPSILVTHRLHQHQLNIIPFIVTSEHKLLFDELKRNKINPKNGTISTVPLSLCSSILLVVEPRSKNVAEVFRELANECYSSEEFWST